MISIRDVSRRFEKDKIEPCNSSCWDWSDCDESLYQWKRILSQILNYGDNNFTVLDKIIQIGLKATTMTWPKSAHQVPRASPPSRPLSIWGSGNTETSKEKGDRRTHTRGGGSEARTKGRPKKRKSGAGPSSNGDSLSRSRVSISSVCDLFQLVPINENVMYNRPRPKISPRLRSRLPMDRRVPVEVSLEAVDPVA